VNQETLQALAASRDIAAYRLSYLLEQMQEVIYDKQNTSSETPPSDTRA